MAIDEKCPQNVSMIILCILGVTNNKQLHTHIALNVLLVSCWVQHPQEVKLSQVHWRTPSKTLQAALASSH